MRLSSVPVVQLRPVRVSCGGCSVYTMRLSSVPVVVQLRPV